MSTTNVEGLAFEVSLSSASYTAERNFWTKIPMDARCSRAFQGVIYLFLLEGLCLELFWGAMCFFTRFCLGPFFASTCPFLQLSCLFTGLLRSM